MAEGQGVEVFGDVSSFLQNATDEADSIKRLVQRNDEMRREEVEQLRREVERERFERRDALNKIRYEFEEFVHKKIDKIVEEVEHFKDVEDGDDVDTWQDKRVFAGVRCHWKEHNTSMPCIPLCVLLHRILLPQLPKHLSGIHEGRLGRMGSWRTVFTGDAIDRKGVDQRGAQPSAVIFAGASFMLQRGFLTRV